MCVRMHVGMKILIFTKGDLPENTGIAMQREWCVGMGEKNKTLKSYKHCHKKGHQNRTTELGKNGVIASYY